MRRKEISTLALLGLAGIWMVGALGCDQRPATAAPPRQAPGAARLGYTKKLVGVTDMATALAKVRAVLKANGFGVITQINVQAVMKKKLGVEGKPYWILGACNPKLANQAITADRFMGLLLPCKVIVFQADDGSFIASFVRPQALFALVKNPQMAGLAAQVDARMKAAHDAL